MAVHPLTNHFRYFFGRINPSASWVQRASSQYQAIKGLIESPYGPAAALEPVCFLQGSYDRHTAIYTINDIDVVALCRGLSFPGSGSGRGWGRDKIFETIAAPLRQDQRYASKVRFGSSSMCIKLDLGINVEILPAVLRQGNSDPANEPFVLHRPETGKWEDGYARLHQAWLSDKNQAVRTGGNFIPIVKAVKHMRSLMSLPAVSFHIECLLWSLDDHHFHGNFADALASILGPVQK